VEEHTCALLNRLDRKRFRLHLVSDPALYERFRRIIPAGVEHTALRVSSLYDAKSAIRFAQILMRRQIRILHTHTFRNSLFASPIGWACRVPIIIQTQHGNEGWRRWKANFIPDRILSRFITRYIAVCGSDARFLMEKKHVAAENIGVVHNGCDTARFRPRPGPASVLRGQLGFAEDDLVLIVVARLHAGKGHRVLLEAVRLLLDTFPRLKLICLGEGELEAELRAACEALCLSDCVRLVGQQSNVPDWLAAADISVLPSFYEGLPLTVLESMACGLPTVASKVGGIPEVIEDGSTGMLVPPGDPQLLARAIASLLHNPEGRARMGRAACARIAGSFTLERQCHQTQEIYFELCDALGVHGEPVALPSSAGLPEAAVQVPVAATRQA
jgi:glycosyltransferase involved in cell wall biosynthesis